MIGWFGLVVVALATYRAARIVALDTITDQPRDALYRWAYVVERGQERARAAWRTYVYALVSCPLCVGVWIAAGFYVLWCWSGSSAVRSALVVLALAGAQCFLATRTDA